MAERIEREYARATQLLDGLTDIRFKLLALVPTLSGTAVGLLRAGESAVTLLAVGFPRPRRNSGDPRLRAQEHADPNRATRPDTSDRVRSKRAALLGDPAAGAAKLFGVIGLRYKTGLALVYAAALAGWGYLVAWGALSALDVGHSRDVGVVIGAAWGLLVLSEVRRLD
ncbi:MAG: hypothetical protein E6G24_10110 [Actinobacteria bacterium]|nr:MAG: hypothetical protein E6G24_10110 [Actinomycetota bacterium]